MASNVNKKALLQLLNEFVPVIGFFISSQLYSFYTATAVLMVLTAIAITTGWYVERQLPILPIISGVFVIVSGLITLLYQAPDVLIFADSLYYLIMGLLLIWSLTRRKPVLKRIFGHVFAITEEGWRKLTLRWAIVFLIGALANELVRIGGSPEFWVNFKVVKVVLVAGFGLYQFTLTRTYRLPEASNDWGLRL